MFKKIKEKEFPDLDYKVQVFQHEGTGALHYHTQYNTAINAFNIYLPTFPTDDTGVAHVLEHSVLNGSKKYPIPGLVFDLMGKNFDVFLNAMTYPDNTQYIFSSLDKKGYFNLMDVFLDAVFFPNLKKEVFLQEACSYQFKNMEAPEEGLKLSGVVYNEMKAAFSKPLNAYHYNLCKEVFKGTLYGNVSGGHPNSIPELTYENFKDFHKKFYHPSNAIFFTAGDLDVSEIHNKLEDNVLSHFEKQEKVMPPECNLDLAGKSFTIPVGANINMYEVGYVLPKLNEVKDLLKANLILNYFESGSYSVNEVLKENNVNLIYNGSSLDGFGNNVVLRQAFSGEDENIKDIACDMLNQYFNVLCEEGIREDYIDAFFEKVLLKIREGKNNDGDKGCNLFNEYTNVLSFGLTEIEEVNDLNILKEMCEELKDKNYFKNWVTSNILKNTNSFEVFGVPSLELVNKIAEVEKAQIEAKEDSLTPAEIKNILKSQQRLLTMQEESRDLSIVPQLTIEDVNPVMPNRVLPIVESVGNMAVNTFNEPANGLLYTSLNFPVVFNEMEDIFVFKILDEIVNDLNIANMTLPETFDWKNRKTVNLSFANRMISNYETEKFQLFLTVGAKGLEENAGLVADKMLELCEYTDFSNKSYIVNNIMQLHTQYQAQKHNNANGLVGLISKAQISNVHAFGLLYEYEFYETYLPKIVEELKSGNLSIIDKVEGMYREICANAPNVFIFADDNAKNILKIKFGNHYKAAKKVESNVYKFKYASVQNNMAVVMPIQVNYNRLIKKVPAYTSKDSGKLSVLSIALNGYMINNIREKGGAYGGGTSYDINGFFTMYSHNDPNCLETFEVFKNAQQFVIDGGLTEADLEKAKLTLVKSINHPKSMLSKALEGWMKQVGDRQKDYSEQTINAIMSTTMADLKRLAQEYLNVDDAYLSIATNQTTFDNCLNNWNAFNSEVPAKKRMKI